MRVIAGIYGGRVLPARVPKGTRPTLDAVREAIFNILAYRVEWSRAHVLDLFAGVGTLGIEAISRGAVHCTFVDSSAAAVKAIAENCRALGIEEERYTIVRDDALRFLQRSGEAYQVVFADPPYGDVHTLQQVMRGIGQARCIPCGALVVVEHAAHVGVPDVANFERVLERRWGETACTIFHANKKPAA